MSETQKQDSNESITAADLQTQFQQDARFNTPAPSKWKRLALLAFVGFLFWIALKLRPKAPEIVYADRYSKTHKYRPAASPIITERLKDGRIRIRGAHVRNDREL